MKNNINNIMNLMALNNPLKWTQVFGIIIVLGFFFTNACDKRSHSKKQTHTDSRLSTTQKVKGLTTQKVFRINAPIVPPYTSADENGFEDLLIKEIYTQLGFRVMIIHVPAERGLVNLNMGIDDGIMSRIGGLEKVYPNIIPFNEVAYEAHYVAFARNKDIKITDWESLKPYRVALVTGWKIFEINVKKYKSLNKVRRPKQLFQLLDSGRVDIVLYRLLAGLWEINNLGLKNIHPLKPAFAKRKKYFYVHKKHKQLIPQADKVLRELKEKGIYKKLYRQITSKRRSVE